MSIIQQSKVRRKIRRKLSLDTFAATLGDSNGVIYDDDRPGYVRVQLMTADGLALNRVVRLRTVVPPIPGIGVELAHDRNGKLAVVGLDYAALESQEISPLIGNPADRNVYGFNDAARILPLIVHPIGTEEVPSMIVAVRELWYLHSDGTWHFFPGQQVTLTAPSAGNHYLAGIYLKTDDTVEVKYSTAQNEIDPLGASDIQESYTARTAGSFPVWFYRLANAQTGVRDTDTYLDARMIFNIGLGGVTLIMPAEFSVAGSGTSSITVTKANENANTVWSGPSSGGAAAPAFRALVEDDIPDLAAPSNLVPNADFETWENGTAAAPDDWTLTGASATVARDGDEKHGDYCALVTRSGTDCHLSATITNYPEVGGANYFRNRAYTFSAYVKCSVASRARLRGNDGVNTYNSSYHTGGGAYEYLSVTFTADSSATAIQVGLAVDTGNTSARIDAATLVEGARAPLAFQPEAHLFNSLPKRVLIFAHTAIVVAGTPSFTRGINANQPYNLVYQSSAASANDGDAISFSFWMRGEPLNGLSVSIEMLGTQAANRGKLDWYLDEELLVSGQDWYAAATTVDVTQTISGVVIHGHGFHVLKAVVNGKNASSTDFVISLTAISIQYVTD